MSRTVAPRIGCSGWNYKSWRRTFYPDALPPSKWLDYYASRFDTVEINGTFYRLPEKRTFATWKEQTPRTFVAAVKASRFLTHMKRLRDAKEPLARLFTRVSGLGAKVGPVLYQLPASFAIDLARLDEFLRMVPRRMSGRRLLHVMEFRHRSWYVRDTYDLLEAHGVALCLHDKQDSRIDTPFVGPFTYVRFHGTSGRYHGSYSAQQLNRWADRLAEQSKGGRRVFAYFNNDPEATATRNAATLKRRVDMLLRGGATEAASP